MVIFKAVTKPVEIAASPERVRAVFLNFAEWSKWHTGHFSSIECHGGKAGVELQKGDKLKVGLSGMTMNPVVQENDPDRFIWVGGLPPLLTGTHYFEFEHSKATPGHTTFRNYEEFGGLVSWFNWSGKERQAGHGFDVFNQDLKRRCESSSVDAEP